MFDKLIHLKNMGYCPDAILDIGAYHGNWTRCMKQIFSCNYFLFEAIDYPQLSSYPDKVYKVLLSDKVGEVDWYQMKNTGDSIFREKTHHFKDCEVIKRETIDLNSLISQENILRENKNLFIKIDCQGSEIPILKGATSILSRTDFILLEIPLFGVYNEGVPNFLEHIKFMDSIGFVPYDILEHHYINNFNMQVDMLFINKTHPFNITVNQKLLY
jgi:FkbM family methyltransferase